MNKAMRTGWAVVTLCVTMSADCIAKESKSSNSSQLKKPTLEASMELLNLWGEQPKSTQELYRYSFKFFEADHSATFADLSESDQFRKLCAADNRILTGGPMLGCVSQTGVSVWVRTAQAAEVKVVVSVDGTDTVFGPVKSTAATDNSAIIPINALKPDSSYSYKVVVDDNEVKISDHAVITTAPAHDSKGTTRLVFGSCFHRWGIGNHQQAEMMLSRKPHAALFYGDVAVQDRNNQFSMHRADFLLRDFAPAWQRLVASTPVYSVWDDHDYFDNDRAGIPKGYTQADKEGVWDVFRTSWNNPSYGFGEAGKGVFHKTRVGACDIIMLDNRYFRTGEKGSFLGYEQMAWLEKQLLACTAPFIVLANGSMWSDFVSEGKDSWGVHDPEGRERIFSLIEKNKIGGVLLLSGDRHGARGFTINRKSGFKFYEFEPASLGARNGPPATSQKWESQLFGFESVYAFGEFTFDTSLDDPEVTFRLIQQDGKYLYEKTLTRSELTP